MLLIVYFHLQKSVQAAKEDRKKEEEEDNNKIDLLRAYEMLTDG